jgi:delta24-sterol reductase
MIGKALDALKSWADDHREWIIIGVALPAGTVAGAIERARSWFGPKSVPSEHDQRVRRVQDEVGRYAAARDAGESWAQKPLRTDRRGAASLNVRMSDKSASQTVNMSDLTHILGVDESRGVVRVEPFVTVGDAAAYLDERGLQLEATIEMKDATLGGLVMALGMTTHSHV